MIRRQAYNQILDSLDLFPVILVIGARQVGKSTLVSQLEKEGRLNTSLSLDDLNILAAAKADPHGFVESLSTPAAIDEIQRCPELIIAIKKHVDTNKKTGQFIITGSANVMSYENVHESLAGRVDIIELEGLSSAEVNGLYTQGGQLIQSFVDGQKPQSLTNPKKIDYQIQSHDVEVAMFYGSYPDVRLKKNEKFRERWFKSYEAAYIEKDVRNLTKSIDIVGYSRTLHMCALQTGNLINYQNIAQSIQLDQRTVKRYIELLRLTFQLSELQPWFSNKGKRLIKTPKIYTNDSGYACYVQGIQNLSDVRTSSFFGSLFETWVYSELRKSCDILNNTKLYYLRTADGEEIDFIVQQGSKLLAIECKSTSTLSNKDLKAIKNFIEIYSEAEGIVLYMGTDIIPLSKKIWAYPISILYLM